MSRRGSRSVCRRSAKVGGGLGAGKDVVYRQRIAEAGYVRLDKLGSESRKDPCRGFDGPTTSGFAPSKNCGARPIFAPHRSLYSASAV
jgi:hypothetical protein